MFLRAANWYESRATAAAIAAARSASEPPYHIAAVANLLSNLYSGRRVVYLNRFTARSWLEVTSAERVTPPARDAGQ